MWQEFNPNPAGRSVGDCAVRAVAAALEIPWEDAFALMASMAYSMGDMPSSNSVWGAVLRQHGFQRESMPNDCPDCYTFEDFARDHPQGTYVLGTGTHTAVIRGGILMDSWDSRREVPQYFWYRKDDL